MHGVYIASSPSPVSQVDFMRELRRAVGMPIGLPATSWMVRVGARVLLRTDPELALYGRYVVSTRLKGEASNSSILSSVLHCGTCCCGVAECKANS